jgi:hypothetical protein
MYHDHDHQQPSRQIYILRTEGEWELAEKHVIEHHYGDLHSYLRREISRLKNKYQECDVCVSAAMGSVKRLRHNIPIEIYDALQPLAERMHKPISTIIDHMLITPLLFPQKVVAG